MSSLCRRNVHKSMQADAGGFMKLLLFSTCVCCRMVTRQQLPHLLGMKQEMPLKALHRCLALRHQVRYTHSIARHVSVLNVSSSDCKHWPASLGPAVHVSLLF